jgi:hypothetical protein
MADTTVNVTTLALNASTANPTGTAVVAANTHVITPTKETSKLVVRLTNTFAGAKAFTIVAGDSPPSDAAGQGNLVLTLAQNDVVFVVLESARFLKSNGDINITVAAATTGFIEAIQLP